MDIGHSPLWNALSSPHSARTLGPLRGSAPQGWGHARNSDHRRAAAFAPQSASTHETKCCRPSSSSGSRNLGTKASRERRRFTPRLNTGGSHKAGAVGCCTRLTLSKISVDQALSIDPPQSTAMRDCANGYSRIKDACLKHPPPFLARHFSWRAFFQATTPRFFLRPLSRAATVTRLPSASAKPFKASGRACQGSSAPARIAATSSANSVTPVTVTSWPSICARILISPGKTILKRRASSAGSSSGAQARIAATGGPQPKVRSARLRWP